MKLSLKFANICAIIAKSVILHHKSYLYLSTSCFTALFFAFCFAEWNSYNGDSTIVFIAWSVLILIPIVKYRFCKSNTYYLPSMTVKWIHATIFVLCITIIEEHMLHSGPISSYVALILLVSTMNGESIFEMIAICVSIASLQHRSKSKMEILHQEMLIWCYFFAAITLGHLFRKVMFRFV